MADAERLIFIFGTLKTGFPNFAANRGRRIDGEFTTREAYPLLLVGERHSPWLILSPGEGCRVRGQVFAVDEAALARMDALERIHLPDGYRRVEIEVVDGGGRQRRVQVYGKPAQQLLGADIRLGPLPEYLPEHAARYRPRAI